MGTWGVLCAALGLGTWVQKEMKEWIRNMWGEDTGSVFLVKYTDIVFGVCFRVFNIRGID